MEQAQGLQYDYSKLIAETRKEYQYESFSMFIDEKIRECRRKNMYDASSFNRSTLADMLKLNPSTLTKIINGSQATRKRDIIIAICFALQLSESETQMALNLYPMVPLNRNNLRDLVIIQALHNGVSVNKLNEILLEHGFNKLNLQRGDSKSEEGAMYIPFGSTSYEEVSVEIEPYCIIGDASEFSLCHRYNPDRFSFRSYMIIENKGEKDRTQYRITGGISDVYDIAIKEDNEWKDVYSNDYIHQKYMELSPCVDPGILNEVTKLQEYTDRRARYVHSMCNDTRNYVSRFGAENNHGQLLIYGERFGCDAPELSEYYQLEVSSNTCLFTVSNSSRFLERYLGQDKWRKLYGILSPPVLYSFTSLDEVKDQRWRSQFQMMLQSARELVDQLRTRKLFIYNAQGLLSIDELMHLFHVEDAFECYQPNDPTYEIMPKRDQITGPDGKPITVADLYRAAELGIFTVEDICNIRTCYGSLENYLQINVLTEQKG